MTTNTDHRQDAATTLERFTAAVERGPESPARDVLLAECASLRTAIRAFHMEAIRFRMFNVDRAISRGDVPLEDGDRTTFAEVRRHLEAAGFHTRSHQAPS